MIVRPEARAEVDDECLTAAVITPYDERHITTYLSLCLMRLHKISTGARLRRTSCVAILPVRPIEQSAARPHTSLSCKVDE